LEPCLESEHNVFEHDYPGWKEGCDMGDLVRRKEDMMHDMSCDLIKAGPPVEQVSFHGHYSCGTRGGKTFSEIERPSYETGWCPEKTLPCTTKTSA
jgi:hypothetical protein